MPRNWNTEIETFPEDVLLICKGAFKAGLYRETPERRLEIMRTMNNHLCTFYNVPEAKRPVVEVVGDLPGPNNTRAPIPQGGVFNNNENKITLDKTSFVSYLTHFAKVLMINNIMGWNDNQPDLMFPLKFSHSLFFNVAPRMYAKALSEGKLVLPREGGDSGMEQHGDR